MKTIKMVTVVEGYLWRSESGRTRVSRRVSTWHATVQQMIGADEHRDFDTLSELRAWFRSAGIKLILPRKERPIAIDEELETLRIRSGMRYEGFLRGEKPY